MLTIACGLFPEIKFCSAINPPNVDVSVHDANSIAALGAAALAYSASRIASPSLPTSTPGLLQLLPGCTCVNDPEEYPDKPNVDRNVVQSAVLYTFVSSSTAIVCPCPEFPALNSGFKL